MRQNWANMSFRIFEFWYMLNWILALFNIDVSHQINVLTLRIMSLLSVDVLCILIIGYLQNSEESHEEGQKWPFQPSVRSFSVKNWAIQAEVNGLGIKLEWCWQHEVNFDHSRTYFMRFQFNHPGSNGSFSSYQLKNK